MDDRPPVNAPPTTAQQQRQRSESTPVRGRPRPPTPCPSPQWKSQSSQSQGQVPITEQNFCRVQAWLARRDLDNKYDDKCHNKVHLVAAVSGGQIARGDAHGSSGGTANKACPVATKRTKGKHKQTLITMCEEHPIMSPSRCNHPRHAGLSKRKIAGSPGCVTEQLSKDTLSSINTPTSLIGSRDPRVSRCMASQGRVRLEYVV
jgi:hypothetical protein